MQSGYVQKNPQWAGSPTTGNLVFPTSYCWTQQQIQSCIWLFLRIHGTKSEQMSSAWPNSGSLSPCSSAQVPPTLHCHLWGSGTPFEWGQTSTAFHMERYKLDQEPSVYEWQVLPFGITCSPCCPSYAVHKHVQDHCDGMRTSKCKVKNWWILGLRKWRPQRADPTPPLELLHRYAGLQERIHPLLSAYNLNSKIVRTLCNNRM